MLEIFAFMAALGSVVLFVIFIFFMICLFLVLPVYLRFIKAIGRKWNTQGKTESNKTEK